MNPRFFLAAAMFLALALPVHAAPPPTPAKDSAELLRQGLFEEEGNRDLGKAAAAYAGVIELYDTQGKFAATAIFRLAEIRVQTGNKTEAVALYQRLLAEFPHQDQLAKLSRERLSTLGVSVTAAPSPKEGTPAAPESEEDKLLTEYQEDSHNHPSYDAAIDQGPYLGKTKMVYAAGKGWVRLLQFMLDHGANVDGWSSTGDPLREAAANGQKDAVALLLSNGARINNPARITGWSALHAACLGRHADIAGLLLDHGIDPDQWCSRAVIPKTIPTHAWGPDLPKFLPAWKDIPLGTPLLIAIRNGDTDTISRLLDHHADPNLYNSPGANDKAASSPLIFALRIGQEAAARLLLERGARAEFATPEGFTALHAAAAGTPTLVSALLERGLPPKADSEGWPPLFYSVYLGGSRHSLNEVKGEENLTPLPEFMNRLSSYEVAWEALLKHGADINAHDQTGATLMHYSVPDDYHPAAVPEWLLAHGANINAPGPRGQTPLAAFSERHGVNWGEENQNKEGLNGITWFMDHGADPSIKDDAGRTPASSWNGYNGHMLAEKYILAPLITKAIGVRAVTAVSPISDSSFWQQRIEPQAEFDEPPSLLLLMEAVLKYSFYQQLDLDIHRALPNGGAGIVEKVHLDVSRGGVDTSKWPALRWGDVVAVHYAGSADTNADWPQRFLAARKDRHLTLQWGDGTVPLALADPTMDSNAYSLLIMEDNLRRAQANQSDDAAPGVHFNRPHIRPGRLPGGEETSSPPNPAMLVEPASLLAWTPAAKPLPGWTLSELVLHLTQAEPRARLDAVRLERSTPDGPTRAWNIDLRASSPAEAELDLEQRPSPVKKVRVWLLDGDRLIIPLRPAADTEALAARRKMISLCAPDGLFTQRLFVRPADDSATHTLAESLVQAYLSPMVLPNPNLSQIVIHRLDGETGEEKTIPVNLTQTILAAAAEKLPKYRESDLPLEWGDRIEIPAIDEVDLLKWKQLSTATQTYLEQCLVRWSMVTLDGQPTPRIDQEAKWLKAEFRPYSAQENSYPLRYQQEGRSRTGTFTALTLLNQLHVNLDTMTGLTLTRAGKSYHYDVKTLKAVNPWLSLDTAVDIQQLTP